MKFQGKPISQKNIYLLMLKMFTALHPTGYSLVANTLTAKEITIDSQVS